MLRPITECRLCQAAEFDSILDLGTQFLTGVFPKSREQLVPSCPVELIKCRKCDLVQLRHSFNPSQLYGMNYGYRSSLNQSMVSHLSSKVNRIRERYSPAPGDLIIDIGSNDSTLLRCYGDGFKLIGIDPSGVKFKDYYPPSIQLLPDFFSAALLKREVGNQKVKVVTSIAMLYDLEDPLGFALEIAEILADNGVWVFEQSYLPSMLEQVAYDTICQEHLEYYGLKQLKTMMDRAGLKIIDLEKNSANGGSLSVTAALATSQYAECSNLVSQLLSEEQRMGLHTLAPYIKFRERIELRRRELRNLFNTIKQNGETILGYGASTKGNVLIQYTQITPEDLPYIAEVNRDKFGAFTPGTHIPIISEEEARALEPDYFLVFPWHFREGIIHRESEFLQKGGGIVFPLPNVDVFERRRSS